MKATTVAVVACLFGLSPCLVAQWRGAKGVRPTSCALADSLIGPKRKNRKVFVTYKPAADSSYLRSGGTSSAPLRMIGMLPFAGRGPVPYPAPSLSFLVGQGHLATRLVSRPPPPDLVLILDDTVTIHFGRVHYGPYRGPIELAIVPINLQMLPAWALSLARAKRAVLKIEADTLKVWQWDLEEFEALYRFATCDTVPTY